MWQGLSSVDGFEEVKLSDLSWYHNIHRKRGREGVSEEERGRERGRGERKGGRDGRRQAGNWVGEAKVVHEKRWTGRER
jgi:hypothetical protein